MANILYHSRKYNEYFRQLLFLGVLITVGLLIFSQLKFFVGAALGAFTLYVVFRTWNFRLTEKWGWRPWVAGLALTFFCFLLLSAIGFGAYKVIANEMPSVDTSKLVSYIKGLSDKVNHTIGFKAVPENVVQNSGGIATKVVGAVLNTTYSFAANIFMMLIIVYFMFTKGRKMECYAYRFSPFKGDSLKTIRTDVKNIVYSNAIGIPVIMVAQTITSSLIYWGVGMENFIFWGFLTALCGLIPLIGCGIVYGLISIYYAATGSIVTGIIILAYGILVISNTDNVIRIGLMKKVNNTHPLIVIFGVIIGIPLFGFWGIIFGPLFLSIFFLLIRIYYTEYQLLRSQDEAEVLAGLRFPTMEAPTVPTNDLQAVELGAGFGTAHIDRQAIEKVIEDRNNLLNNDPCDCVGPHGAGKRKKDKKGLYDRLGKDKKKGD